ncbi:MAG: hypothetical protein QW540_09185 [Archaeoglobaceae archaeon]
MKCPACKNEADFLYFAHIGPKLFEAYRCLNCGNLFFEEAKVR